MVACTDYIMAITKSQPIDFLYTLGDKPKNPRDFTGVGENKIANTDVSQGNFTLESRNKSIST